jgi:hypothetical protein
VRQHCSTWSLMSMWWNERPQQGHTARREPAAERGRFFPLCMAEALAVRGRALAWEWRSTAARVQRARANGRKHAYRPQGNQ